MCGGGGEPQGQGQKQTINNFVPFCDIAIRVKRVYRIMSAYCVSQRPPQRKFILRVNGSSPSLESVT